MKNLTIKITVPERNDKWHVTVGSGHKKRKNAVEAFSYVERFLQRKSLTSLASHSKGKIKVLVDYAVIHNDKPGK